MFLLFLSVLFLILVFWIICGLDEFDVFALFWWKLHIYWQLSCFGLLGFGCCVWKFGVFWCFPEYLTYLWFYWVCLVILLISWWVWVFYWLVCYIYVISCDLVHFVWFVVSLVFLGLCYVVAVNLNILVFYLLLVVVWWFIVFLYFGWFQDLW